MNEEKKLYKKNKQRKKTYMNYFQSTEEEKI